MILPNIKGVAWSEPQDWTRKHDALYYAAAQTDHVYGSFIFIGPVIVQFLVGNKDRIVKVMQKFTYVDSFGQYWPVEAGTIVDGASIPRFLWSLLGSPFTGEYRRAAVVHDAYCDNRRKPYKSVNRVFYDAMMTDKMYWLKAKIFYYAVSIFGPKWK